MCIRDRPARGVSESSSELLDDEVRPYYRDYISNGESSEYQDVYKRQRLDSQAGNLRQNISELNTRNLRRIHIDLHILHREKVMRQRNPLKFI